MFRSLNKSSARVPSSWLARVTGTCCSQVPKTTAVSVRAAASSEDKATPAPPPKAKAKTKAYYAVPTKGIYQEYRAEVLPALKGEKGVVHCKFDTEEEAKGWLDAYEKGEPCEYTGVSPQ